MDKNFAIEQMIADIKNWQDSSEAYRRDCEQLQIQLRSVIEAYDYCNQDPADRGYSVLDSAIGIARHLLVPVGILPND